MRCRLRHSKCAHCAELEQCKQRLTLSLAAAAVGLVMAPSLAMALTAITTGSTNLRAGPASNFPVVDRIPADARVNVHGCVRAYRWCDVSWRDARGWLPGGELAYLRNGRRETIVEYGPRIGVPVVGFSIDSYWDRYYRGRAWYGDRARWRTAWRERDHDHRRSAGGERRREGRETTVNNRSERSQLERTERRPEGTSRAAERRDRSERQTSREEQRNVRTGRDRTNRSEVHGYNPPGVRQNTDRGSRHDTSRGAARTEPSARLSGASARPSGGGAEGGRAGANVGPEGRR
jgi:uncharacterized protein YraI